jgi:hypothetical protein
MELAHHVNNSHCVASPEHDIPDRQRASLIFVSHLREIAALKIFAKHRSDVASVALMRRSCVDANSLRAALKNSARDPKKFLTRKNGTTLIARSYRDRVATRSPPHCVFI